MFVVLLTNLVNTSSNTKCVSASNKKCEIQLTRFNLHPDGYSKKFHNYPFAVNLARCVGSCNTLMTYLIKYVFQTKQKM